MEHYICPACRGVSEHPKVCETADCSHEGQSLAACNCADNSHAQVQQSSDKAE